MPRCAGRAPASASGIFEENTLATGLALAMAALLVAPPATAAGKAAPTAKVNLNIASVEQLTTLPGVGPKLAARIVEYRQKSGGFKSVQELMNVKGVGEKNFARLQPHITASEPAAKAPAQ